MDFPYSLSSLSSQKNEKKPRGFIKHQMSSIFKMHKRETDELNRKHEQKLQEAAQNHTNEVTKQKQVRYMYHNVSKDISVQKHQKELKAARQFAAGRSSTENSDDDDVEEDSRYI